MESSLIKACEEGYLDKAKQIVESWDNITKWDMSNGVMKAAEEGHLPIVKYLHEQGAKIYTSEEWCLRYAAERGHLDVVKYLIEQGADIHADSDCALRWTCYSGQLEVVKYLVEQGANVHVKGDLELRWCFDNGYVSTFIYLTSLYQEEELHSIVSFKHPNFISFCNVMYFFFYQKDRSEMCQDECLWDGNIGLIVASFAWS